jgi:hypothetical protein
MRRPLVIYDFAPDKENFILFFISVLRGINLPGVRSRDLNSEPRFELGACLTVQQASALPTELRCTLDSQPHLTLRLLAGRLAALDMLDAGRLAALDMLEAGRLAAARPEAGRLATPGARQGGYSTASKYVKIVIIYNISYLPLIS